MHYCASASRATLFVRESVLAEWLASVRRQGAVRDLVRSGRNDGTELGQHHQVVADRPSIGDKAVLDTEHEGAVTLEVSGWHVEASERTSWPIE